MSDDQVKFVLSEQDIPTHWVNLMADLPGDPAAAASSRHQGAGGTGRSVRRSSRWR